MKICVSLALVLLGAGLNAAPTNPNNKTPSANQGGPASPSGGSPSSSQKGGIQNSPRPEDRSKSLPQAKANFSDQLRTYPPAKGDVDMRINFSVPSSSNSQTSTSVNMRNVKLLSTADDTVTLKLNSLDQNALLNKVLSGTGSMIEFGWVDSSGVRHVGALPIKGITSTTTGGTTNAGDIVHVVVVTIQTPAGPKIMIIHYP